MSTLKADAVTATTTNGDLALSGNGTGVPDIEAGFKVGSVAGVPTASIRDDAVTTAKIVDDAVTTAKIVDDAVTLAKMATGVDGVIITYDASGDPVHVGPGSDGEVLTSTGAGSPPAFEAVAAGGGLTLISTALLSTASSVELTGMSTTYEHYLLTWTAIESVSYSELGFYVQFADSSSIRTSLYSQRVDQLNGATDSFENDWDSSHPRIDLGEGASNTGGVRSASGHLNLHFPTDGATYPKVMGQYVANHDTTTMKGGGILGWWNGVINPTKLAIYGNVTTLTGRFSLYGVVLS